MIELKNLTKIYTTKAGEVRALDDVSVTLPDKGIVFILGKSGSGKSTLLNVVGGLDRVTSGEIIIDGKSSASFKDGDFDAYRNTYIGFVFQEYNLLNDFSIADNVALATDLQGKRDAKRIEEILETVDLKDMGSRKPNTLSGGQKQRVALARALVKNPAVIMADEPTGALDSATGEQIFQTLKNLSKEKLVIVVSHDRDFAQRYGDRLIELEDGKIVRDSEGDEAIAKKLSEDVAVSGSTLLVKTGAVMTEENVTALRRALAEAPESKVVFRTEEELKEATEGKRKRERSAEDNDAVRPPLKLIRSRLPVMKATRLGANSMKKKPLRLIITIFLSAIAFGLFGIADTMLSYNLVDATVRTIQDSNIDYATYRKNVTTVLKYDAAEKPEKPAHTSPSFVLDDINLVEKETGLNFFPFYTTLYPLSNLATKTEYYTQKISGYIEMDEEKFPSLGYQFIGEGSRLPVDETEIAITKHHYDHYHELGYQVKPLFDDPYILAIEKPEDLLGKELSLGYGKVKVVGIIDTGFSSRYKNLNRNLVDTKDLKLDELNEWESYNDEVSNSFHSAIFVVPGYAQKNFKNYLGKVTYSRLIAKMPTNKNVIRRAVKFGLAPIVTTTYDEKTMCTTTTTTTFTLLHKSSSFIDSADQLVGNLSRIFLYAGLGCALFAALLLYNFISVSIQHKKREIGILRALGARKADVFFIFLAECLLISLFSWGASCIFAGIGPTIINDILNQHLGVDISLLAFGVRQVLIMLGVSVFIGIIGCFLPTYRAARKKPVDAIRS